jgi:hypothetical protein
MPMPPLSVTEFQELRSHRTMHDHIRSREQRREISRDDVFCSRGGPKTAQWRRAERLLGRGLQAQATGKEGALTASPPGCGGPRGTSQSGRSALPPKPVHTPSRTFRRSRECLRIIFDRRRSSMPRASDSAPTISARAEIASGSQSPPFRANSQLASVGGKRGQRAAGITGILMPD